jgi:hypothetical protein
LDTVNKGIILGFRLRQGFGGQGELRFLEFSPQANPFVNSVWLSGKSLKNPHLAKAANRLLK